MDTATLVLLGISLVIFFRFFAEFLFKKIGVLLSLSDWRTLAIGAILAVALTVSRNASYAVQISDITYAAIVFTIIFSSIRSSSPSAPS